MQPSELPEWALLDVQDPLSGQYNVVEPPQEVKNEGWRIGEKPNRQWWNWYNRTVYDWIVYFNSILGTGSTSQSLVPIWDGLTVQPTVNEFYYSLVGDKCFITGNMQYAGNANVGTVLAINNLPFPAKNIAALRNTLQVERGSSATMANGKTLYANVSNSFQGLIFLETDLATGISIDTLIKGASGELRYSGFYLIEPAP